MSQPAWHQWISYETKFLDREAIANLTIDSLEYSINLRERYGFYSKSQADTARFCFVDAGKETITVVDDAMQLHDEAARLERLKSFREELDRELGEMLNKRPAG